MNQQEIQSLFAWATDSIVGFEVEDCEESYHCYYNGTFVGGWAGDSREYFFKHSDDLARLIRMYDAFNSVK